MFYHPVLGGIDIIRNTVEPQQPGFTIVDCIAGLWVTIPGLPHTTGVNNQSVPAHDKPDIRLELAGGTTPAFTVTEHQGHMRMTHQAKVGFEVSKIFLIHAG